MQNIYRFCIYANCMASAGCSVKRNAAYQKNIIVHNCRGTLWSLLASMLNQRLPRPQKKTCHCLLAVASVAYTGAPILYNYIVLKTPSVEADNASTLHPCNYMASERAINIPVQRHRCRCANRAECLSRAAVTKLGFMVACFAVL